MFRLLPQPIERTIRFHSPQYGGKLRNEFGVLFVEVRIKWHAVYVADVPDICILEFIILQDALHCQYRANINVDSAGDEHPQGQPEVRDADEVLLADVV